MIATEAHGITRKKVFYGSYSSVFFRVLPWLLNILGAQRNIVSIRYDQVERALVRFADRVRDNERTRVVFTKPIKNPGMPGFFISTGVCQPT